MAITTDRPKAKSLSGLGMVWEFAGRYPTRLVIAALILVLLYVGSGVRALSHA